MEEERFTILVVDDERSNISALSYILRSKYVVLAAKNGQSAIEIAQSGSPDLILLDVIMPGISGFDVLAELKNSERTKDIPVIFISGLDDNQYEEKGLLLGAVDYITKPFHNSIVKLRVKTHLKILEQMRTIERLGMIDVLTDLPNRRSFNDRLVTEWNRAVREKSAFSILMLDIDKFKAFNDNYGHACGDEALKTVAGVISRTLNRTTDFAARWGGEEFAVLLPRTELNGALDVAEQIRGNAENAVVLSPDDKEIKLTVSIGVNSERPVTGASVNDFVAAADKALYLAKEEGRNRVKSL